MQTMEIDVSVIAQEFGQLHMAIAQLKSTISRQNQEIAKLKEQLAAKEKESKGA